MGTAGEHEPDGDADDRPVIFLDTEEELVNDAVIDELHRVDDLYEREGSLCRVVAPTHSSYSAAVKIRDVGIATLREMLTRAVRFEEEGKRGQTRPARPPDWCTRAVHARGAWPSVRPLRGVVQWPVMKPDGTVLQTPGYDSSTALLYVPGGVFLPVADVPSSSEIDASKRLLTGLVKQFPFCKPEHLSAWVAMLLTPFVRYAYEGHAPLGLITANTRGTGKTKLAQLISIILTGRSAPQKSQVMDEAEDRKRFTIAARCSDALFLIDNVSKPFGNGTIDTALHSVVWGDRILNTSEAPEYPFKVTFLVTGNNIQIRAGADTARRSLAIRLETSHQNPERRSDLEIADIEGYAEAHRPQLVHACLTLLRGYFAHAGPDCFAQKLGRDGGLPPWGSYEKWTEWIRKPLVFFGFDDPYKAHEALEDEADTTATGVSLLVQGWADLCQQQNTDGATAREALDWLSEDLETRARYSGGRLRFEMLHSALQELCPLNGRQLPDPRALGYCLRSYRGRVVDGLALSPVREDKRGQLWGVVEV